MTPKTFLYAEADGIGTITLNRPDRLNALTFEVYRELTDMFAHLQKRDSVRVVIITGNGKGFCSGGDVEDIIGELFARDAEGLYRFTRMSCDLVENMRRLTKPVIAALNGTVAGAGAVIAAASDFRFANTEAKISFLFTKVGLSAADMGICHLLPRIVGLTQATQLLMTGEIISAQRALEINLYNKVVPPEKLMEEVNALARSLADGPTFGLAVTKDAINSEMNMDVFSALEYEASVQAACMMHSDFREAYNAWREKRKPAFKH
jgi:enoyl-CoA hydratase/carnithine racemase